MQSIFRWCSDTVGEGGLDKIAAQKMRPQPVMDISLLSDLKRKRTESPDPELAAGTRDAKRQRVEQVQVQVQPTHLPQISTTQTSPPRPRNSLADSVISDFGLDRKQSVTYADQTAAIDQLACTMDNPHTTTDMKRKQLQETIEQQFNLEILTKHRELRLIEQELAKCQTALEQLRRCEMIPFPGSDGLSETVSAGTGPSLKPRSGYTQPSAPAPWGVMDGPYTRHYAKWLIPDPTFDSILIQQMHAMNDGYGARSEGRSTRNSGAGLVKPAKTRFSRESISGIPPSQPLPSVAPRNKAGPLVIRRMMDNQFVKLVCNNCQRSDFSSVQGFLNHCRIAHKIDYKSHESAAQDCGRPLEEHEQDLAAQAPPPVGTTTARTPAPKPAPIATTTSRVHPLNTHTAPRPTWKRQRLEWAQRASSANHTPARSSNTLVTPSSVSTSFHASPFVPSATAPYLSAQFAKHGFGGDLKAVAAKAKERIELGSEDYDEEDRGGSSKSSPAVGGDAHASRTVSGAAHIDTERPQSRKGHRQPAQRPRPAPLSSLQAQKFSSEIPESPQDTNLSPHTADSNPGLVSDHDDDPVSEPDEEARSEIEPALRMSRECGDAMDVDIEVEDDGDSHGVLIRPRSMLAHGHEEMNGAGSPSRPRSSYRERVK